MFAAFPSGANVVIGSREVELTGEVVVVVEVEFSSVVIVVLGLNVVLVVVVVLTVELSPAESPTKKTTCRPTSSAIK